MKVGTNIHVKYNQVCREHEPLLCLHVQGNYVISSFSSVGYTNYSGKFLDIFTKFASNIKHDQTMCKIKNNSLAYMFTEFCPFEILSMKIVSTL